MRKKEEKRPWKWSGKAQQRTSSGEDQEFRQQAWPTNQQTVKKGTLSKRATKVPAAPNHTGYETNPMRFGMNR